MGPFPKKLLNPPLMRLISTFVISSRKHPKKIVSRVHRKIIFCVGMVKKTRMVSLFKKNDSSLAATALLAKLDRKRRDRWSEAVRSIDISYFICKAWSVLNNVTGRSRHSPRQCPVSADPIAFQLVRKWRYEAVDHKLS